MAKELEIPADLYEQMSKAYRKGDLVTSMQPLVFKFLLRNEKLALEEGVSKQLYSKLRLNYSALKRDMLRLCCIPFLTPKLLEAFLKFLPENIRNILDELMWNEELSEDAIKRDFGIEIVKRVKKKRGSYYSYYDEEIRNPYQFFSAKSEYSRHQDRGNNYILYLVSALRKLLIKNAPKPKNYYLNPTTLGKTDFVYQGEKDIFLELPRLIVYYEQGNIKKTKKDRPAASTFSKMKRTLGLIEFFGDTKESSLRYLRTNALAGLLVFSNKLRYGKNHTMLVKKLFEQYQKKSFLSFPRLMPHLKGASQLYDYDLESVEHHIFGILQEMPLDDWVTMENIVDFVKYHNLNIRPISDYMASNRLYLEDGGSKRYDDRHYIKENLYQSAIIEPFIKANFFLFAAFGLLDIAYNEPDSSKTIETYFSPYDGLQFVKLTELGKYVLGKKKKYSQPEGSKQVPLVLSKDSLMILSDETDTTADILLRTYTQKVGSNRYQTDTSIFLSGCSTERQLEDKIKLFKKTVSSKPPENWKAFFEELRNKVNPFSNVVEMYALLKIPPSNKELIQLIAQDKVLKSLVLKAEGFHIFVLKSKLTKFKSHLKEFGYLIDNA